MYCTSQVARDTRLLTHFGTFERHEDIKVVHRGPNKKKPTSATNKSTQHKKERIKLSEATARVFAASHTVKQAREDKATEEVSAKRAKRMSKEERRKAGTEEDDEEESLLSQGEEEDEEEEAEIRAATKKMKKKKAADRKRRAKAAADQKRQAGVKRMSGRIRTSDGERRLRRNADYAVVRAQAVSNGDASDDSWG